MILVTWNVHLSQSFEVMLIIPMNNLAMLQVWLEPRQVLPFVLECGWLTG